MSELQAAIEAILYAAEEPPTVAQLAAALLVEPAEVETAIDNLRQRYASDEYGVEVRAVAGGFRIATKPQHHDSVRLFLKSLKPPIRLSLAALETLAVIAYRQPITLPEVREIRGVDPAGVINTLLDKKLVSTAGRKEVIGKPILYRTTRDFLKQFGLNSLRDLPTLKEFEEMAQAGLEGLETVESIEKEENGESERHGGAVSSPSGADQGQASAAGTDAGTGPDGEPLPDAEDTRPARAASGDSVSETGAAEEPAAEAVKPPDAGPASPPAPEPDPSTEDPARSGAASRAESLD